jgi:hypothetical protein
MQVGRLNFFVLTEFESKPSFPCVLECLVALICDIADSSVDVCLESWISWIMLHNSSGTP